MFDLNGVSFKSILSEEFAAPTVPTYRKYLAVYVADGEGRVDPKGKVLRVLHILI